MSTWAVDSWKILDGVGVELNLESGATVALAVKDVREMALACDIFRERVAAWPTLNKGDYVAVRRNDSVTAWIVTDVHDDGIIDLFPRRDA